MLDRIDSRIAYSRNALNARAYQQELLASNIANADTPHYKARDIDFKSALANLTAGKAAPGTLAIARTDAAHQGGGGANPLAAYTKYRSEYQSAVDGNTVNLDIERSAFAENAVHMEALLTFIRSEFRDLQAAMQPQ
ncbi:MAG: flagellar basal body rod protein FlgB [Rhodocyclales bacterium]|nr:flagellar basal body rod protein FlgB [Rhodocyclales bacterium]